MKIYCAKYFMSDGCEAFYADISYIGTDKAKALASLDDHLLMEENPEFFDMNIDKVVETWEEGNRVSSEKLI